MPKYRKMLNDWQAPYIQSLMRLIETQSKITLANWCLDYAERVIVPIYEKHCHGDTRPQNALTAAREWLSGNIKLPEVKKIILSECHAAARELDSNPIAQAAARTCGQAASCIHAPTHSLGLRFTARLPLLMINWNC